MQSYTVYRRLYAFMMLAELETIHIDYPVKREETSLQIQHLELLNFGVLLHCTKRNFLRNNLLVCLVLEIFAVALSCKSVCLGFIQAF